MREIKFRAWNKDSKKMVEGSELWRWFNTERNKGIVEGTINMNQTDIDQNNYKHLELLQFTGLHDKNGKEIYEGDIVRSDKMFGEVVWGYDASWGIHGKVIKKDWENCEVIGNIYENPMTKVKKGEPMKKED